MNLLLPAEPSLMHALIAFDEARENLSTPTPRLTPQARGVSAVAAYAQMQLLWRVLNVLKLQGEAATAFILKALEIEAPLHNADLISALNTRLSTEGSSSEATPPQCSLDEELGRTAMRFVDRAGDVHPGIDDADKICKEFYEAMSEVISRRLAIPGAIKSQPTSEA